MQLFNATTQQLEDVKWSTDVNNEIIATFKNGHFYKFPGGLSEADLQKLAAGQQVANEGQEVITPELLASREKQRADSEALIAKLNGTPPNAG